MLLHLENIGKLSAADVQLRGITVIAGENNTGKSTVGKVLYSIFNSFFNFENQVRSTRINLLAQDIEKLFIEHYDPYEMESYVVAQTMFKVSDANININTVRNIIDNNVNFYSDSFFDDEEDDDELTVSDDFIEAVIDLYRKYKEIPDLIIYQNIFNRRIRLEFASQINNVFSKNLEGKIALTIRDKEVEMVIRNNKVASINDTLSLKTEILYIDDPFVLDSTSVQGYKSFYYVDNLHKRHLVSKLTSRIESTEVEEAFKEFLVDGQIEKIMSKINSVCEGNLSFKYKEGFIYSPSNAGASFNIGNISVGLKTFAIIKTLLVNGALEKNGTIVLDEPEIHLHPEWQLLFAEIIVLLQKEFELHVLLTTHSPYFLEAIEVYSKKYGINDKCKYYLAESKGNISHLEDVTDNTEKIYQKLAYPFQILENERYSND